MAQEADRETDPHAETRRLVAVRLDKASIGAASRDIEHERAIAIHDLIEENAFFPLGDPDPGPYDLLVSLADNRLVLDIARQDGEPVVSHHLSLSPLRKAVKDYFFMCETYYEAIRTASRAQIEALDMGRRGLHNEGAELLRERLKEKIALDFHTSRRLFTLICALHWKG
ncbi:UPF0262 family protein [Ancylobacter sp. 6x-1]|uniref:UPF0262 protein MWN34_17205 n=1 Tax=Ancylobacter crimeensis TaxID=2579147 RepID=A0ABT0DFA7_9HYPH|nr:UPF0262 family protein [Ancylobacter crimeensis]MCK0198638.1 UPF0262 family protein [Ancylobacter crimeensis]